VTEQQRAFVAAAVGAVAGGIAGYLLFTERGRDLRRRMEPAIEDFARELVQLRGTVNRAMGVASEGWHVLNEALGERGGSSVTYPRHTQTDPF
jgi:gas vesicle protein